MKKQILKIFKQKSIAFLTFLLISISMISQNSTTEIKFQIGQEERMAIIDTVIKYYNNFYVFPDIAKKYEAKLREQLNLKAYDGISGLSDFTDQLTKDMLSVYPDRHLRVMVFNEIKDLADTNSYDDWWENHTKYSRFINYGFNKIERMPGNIGYLELNFMEYIELSRKTADAALAFLSNSKAIIIDLRENPGGRQKIVQLLMSYFLEAGTHYNSEVNMLTGENNKLFTLENIAGERLLNTPLYLLTSANTGSAAETFSYSLKHLDRAMIIGGTTAGAAHKTHDHSFPNLHITLAIPDGKSVNPKTGTDWEGIGVIPHINVSADKALEVAYAMALDTILGKEKDKLIRFKLDWVKKEIDIKVNPITLDRKTMDSYVGQYGVRTIKIINNDLYYQREGRAEYKMIPLEVNLFMLEGLDYFRIKFKKDKDGNIAQLTGLYDDGSKSISKRNNN